MEAARRLTLSAGVVAVAVSAIAADAGAAIDLALVPDQPVYTVGETVSIGLYASSDSDSAQLLSALQTVLVWDPAFMTLTGIDDAGGSPLLISTFGPDPSGINESNPPADGDGLYQAGALLGSPIAATPGGVLITTFLFDTQFSDGGTGHLDMLDVFMGPTGPAGTIVFDGTVPGLHITGTLTSATITIQPIPTPPAIALGIVAVLCAPRRRR